MRESMVSLWSEPDLLKRLEAEGKLEEFKDTVRMTVTLVHPILKGTPSREDAEKRVLEFYGLPVDFLSS